MASNGYQELVNAIIRPPRAEYDMDDLGPASFEWHGHAFQRVDLELSGGDWVSLGYWERDDLATVVAHLRASGKVSTVALWGRSMGSACALCHGHRDPSISAMVCGGARGPPQLAEELVQKARDHGLSVPGFVVSIALRMRDDFIDPAHSRALHGKYAGDKNLVLVEGDHNFAAARFLDSAAIFLSNYMGVPPAAAIPGADAFNGGYPPWIPSDHYGLNLADLGFSDLDLDQQNLGMTRPPGRGPGHDLQRGGGRPRGGRPAPPRRGDAPPGRPAPAPGQRRRRAAPAPGPRAAAAAAGRLAAVRVDDPLGFAARARGPRLASTTSGGAA
ncbi:palmitoyl-(protein) hydrolase [Aureococcus anophagefferens]|nr:palmitoyl-(protein) hydrolase [Aureococcus anophagefferens]